jgi:hypothetical protein
MYNACLHIKSSGCRCKTPALHGSNFCFFHNRLHADALSARFDTLRLPVSEDCSSILLALNRISNAIVDSRIDSKRAAQLIWIQQLAIQVIDRRDSLNEESIQTVGQSAHGEELALPLALCEPGDDCGTCTHKEVCPRSVHFDDCEDFDEDIEYEYEEEEDDEEDEGEDESDDDKEVNEDSCNDEASEEDDIEEAEADDSGDEEVDEDSCIDEASEEDDIEEAEADDSGDEEVDEDSCNDEASEDDDIEETEADDSGNEEVDEDSCNDEASEGDDIEETDDSDAGGDKEDEQEDNEDDGDAHGEADEDDGHRKNTKPLLTQVKRLETARHAYESGDVLPLVKLLNNSAP